MPDHASSETPFPAFQTSPETDKLDTAIAKAQAIMEHATKDADNPHFGSKYANIAAIMTVARKALKDSGVAIYQFPIDWNEGEFSILTRLAFQGQFMQSIFSVPVVKKDPQGYASACTYTRRITLAAALGIAPDDDDDGETASGRGRRSGWEDFDQTFHGEQSSAPKKAAPKAPSANTTQGAIKTPLASGRPVGTTNVVGVSLPKGKPTNAVPSPVPAASVASENVETPESISARADAAGYRLPATTRFARVALRDIDHSELNKYFLELQDGMEKAKMRSVDLRGDKRETYFAVAWELERRGKEWESGAPTQLGFEAGTDA